MAYQSGSLSRHDETAAIFSPSVARIAASTARDWSFVDSWLASKFPAGRPVPSFERNQDTLKVLLNLAAANEAADEERQLLARLDASTLQDLERHDVASTITKECANMGDRPGLVRTNLLNLVQRGLPKEGSDALNSLARLAVSAGAALSEPEDLGRNIVHLQSYKFEVQRMSSRLEALERHALAETESAVSLARIWQSNSFKPSPDLAKQNLDLQRKIKLTASQLDDSRERLGTKQVPVAVTHPTIEDLCCEEQELLSLISDKKELDAQIAAFGNLPNDPEAARHELDALRRQLGENASRRDALFESLVERESPVKRR